MTALAAHEGELAAAALGAATGLVLALAASPFGAEVWAFIQRGFESALFSYFLC